jgi:hypothetical protein
MKPPYGYTQHESGAITINQEQAGVVNLIYDLYLQGKSLGGIVGALKEQGVPSPTVNPTWVRAAIDKLLSNGRYVPHIIPEDQFLEAQLEKDRRTNLKPDNRTRKTARYNSQNVLSGLLICGDCGRNYRRITRPSGEVVWRCADRVENGKRAACSNLSVVSDEESRGIVCEHLGLEVFDEAVVGAAIDTIEISGMKIVLQMKPSLSLEMQVM